VGSHLDSVFVADINGDRDMDIITLNVGSGAVSVLLGNSTGEFTEASRQAAKESKVHEAES